MRRGIWLLIFLVSPFASTAKKHESLTPFFLNIVKLEFDAAKKEAIGESDSLMRFEAMQLADLLFYEGQKERAFFNLTIDKKMNTDDSELLFVRFLNAGYESLFYDRTKSNAYKYFYDAYQIAKKINNAILIKASLLAFFKYYNFEIVQTGDSYKAHLDHFESLKEGIIDEVWLTIYKMIYYSKPAGKVDDDYFELFLRLDRYEQKLNHLSPLLARIFYEKAICYEIKKNSKGAEEYLKKVIDQSKDYPFLKNEKFFSLIKLLNLETGKKHFLIAKRYLQNAKREINLADTLRSSYYLNLYGSLFYRAQNKNDSAFILLMRAYLQEYQLDFRRNTLTVNQLNVELKTQEKENANLQLRQNRIWLIAGLVVAALLFLVSYFAYSNQRAKNRVQAKEKQLQALKLEKVLKDQEIFGIDSMIEGQEKERLRIAGDLHDNLGSLLATVKLHFHSLKKSKNYFEHDQEQLLQKTDDLLDEAYQKVRTMAHAGNAGVNAQEGLLPAVKIFASKVSILNRLTIDVEDHGMNGRLENSLEITIFRIIQELVTNIIKHAQANEVVIHLTQYEEAINLMVEDNGIGFDISKVKPSGGIGLYSIQKKIENLGGRVTIDSIPQKGTTVIIDVPLA